MEAYTIGFSKKSLRNFIELLQDNQIDLLIDTRLNNTSQLAGFAKKKDLEFILEVFEIGYIHKVELAPDEKMLKQYKKKEISWEEYEVQYLELIKQRKVENLVQDDIKQKRVCFLCSEATAYHCHRRLLIEYLSEKLENQLTISHL